MYTCMSSIYIYRERERDTHIHYVYIYIDRFTLLYVTSTSTYKITYRLAPHLGTVGPQPLTRASGVNKHRSDLAMGAAFGGSFKRGLGMEIDMDIDSDVALSKKLGDPLTEV